MNIQKSKVAFVKLTLIALTICFMLAAPARAQESETTINARITELTAKITAAPNNDSLYDQRGTAYFALGKISEALADANSAIGINPKNTNALFLRGQIKGGKKDYDGAIADYTPTINAYPNAAFRAYLKRGEMYEKKGDREKARADYAKAFEISKPKSAEAATALERVGGAVNTVNTASGGKTGASSQSDVDQFSKQNPNFGAATTKLDTQIAAAPNDDNLYALRAREYFRLKKYDEALSDAGKAIQLNPKNTNALVLRGLAKHEKRDYDGAIADFTQVIKLAPNQGIAYIGRGAAYERKEDLDEAIADYAKAAEVDPKSSQTANDKRLSAENLKAINRTFGYGKDPYSRAYRRYADEHEAFGKQIEQIFTNKIVSSRTTPAQKKQALEETLPLYQKQREVNVRALAELPKFNDTLWEKPHKQFFVDNIATIDKSIDAARRGIKKWEQEIK